MKCGEIRENNITTFCSISLWIGSFVLPFANPPKGLGEKKNGQRLKVVTMKIETGNEPRKDDISLLHHLLQLLLFCVKQYMSIVYLFSNIQNQLCMYVCVIKKYSRELVWYSDYYLFSNLMHHHISSPIIMLHSATSCTFYIYRACHCIIMPRHASLLFHHA